MYALLGGGLGVLGGRAYPGGTGFSQPPRFGCNKVRRNDMKAKELMFFCLAIVAGLSSFFSFFLRILVLFSFNPCVSTMQRAYNFI
jgi:hypothetical protein